MIKTLSVTAAAFLMASVASAAAPEADDSKREKKICKTEKMTGSLTRVRRICATQIEWDRAAANTGQTVKRIERSANHAEAMTPRMSGHGPGGHGHVF